MPRSEPDQLVDAAAAAAYVTKVTGRSCVPATIRQWATRGHVTRQGQRGRNTLYDLREIHTRATGRDPYEDPASPPASALLAQDPDPCHTQPVFGMP